MRKSNLTKATEKLIKLVMKIFVLFLMRTVA